MWNAAGVSSVARHGVARSAGYAGTETSVSKKAFRGLEGGRPRPPKNKAGEYPISNKEYPTSKCCGSQVKNSSEYPISKSKEKGFENRIQKLADLGLKLSL